MTENQQPSTALDPTTRGTAEVPYKVSTDAEHRSGYGPAVWFGNDLFQKSGSGDC